MGTTYYVFDRQLTGTGMGRLWLRGVISDFHCGGSFMAIDYGDEDDGNEIAVFFYDTDIKPSDLLIITHFDKVHIVRNWYLTLAVSQ